MGGVSEIQSIRDVFTDKPLVKEHYDADQFIPWSFVMNDELWNLIPMDSTLNSSESDHLSKWDPFFERFAENQYQMYVMVNEIPKLHKIYELCFKDNLHSIWAGQELYRKGNNKQLFSTF